MHSRLTLAAGRQLPFFAVRHVPYHGARLRAAAAAGDMLRLLGPRRPGVPAHLHISSRARP